jgi:hypothetical protein
MLTEDMNYVMSLTDKKSRKLALVQILKSAADKYAISTNFLERATDMPRLDSLTCTILIQSMFETTPMAALDTPMMAKSQVCPMLLRLDSKTTHHVWEANNDVVTVQELLGKHKSNLSVIKTDIMFNIAIYLPGLISTKLVNNAVYLWTIYMCNTKNYDYSSNPITNCTMCRLAVCLTAKETCFFSEINSSAQRSLGSSADYLTLWTESSLKSLMPFVSPTVS